MIINAVYLLLVGLGAGCVGGLLGLGGGILLMPVLRFGLGLPPPMAVGTCIVGVFCTTFAGGWRHYCLGHVNIRSLMPVITAGIISSAVCSLIFIKVVDKGGWIDLSLGMVFALVALRMIRAGLRRRHSREDFIPGKNSVEGAVFQKSLIGSVAGMLPGMLGIGTGAILVPTFTMMLHAPIKVAMGSSLVCFAMNALISAGFKWHQGFVDWRVGIPICLGALGGSMIGARLNKHMPTSVLKILFGVVFIYIAAKFILSSKGISL